MVTWSNKWKWRILTLRASTNSEYETTPTRFLSNWLYTAVSSWVLRKMPNFTKNLSKSNFSNVPLRRESNSYFIRSRLKSWSIYEFLHRKRFSIKVDYQLHEHWVESSLCSLSSQDGFSSPSDVTFQYIYYNSITF